ncbi:hypothetical protein [Arthrobacter sp. NPDC057013]
MPETSYIIAVFAAVLITLIAVITTAVTQLPVGRRPLLRHTGQRRRF